MADQVLIWAISDVAAAAPWAFALGFAVGFAIGAKYRIVKKNGEDKSDG